MIKSETAILREILIAVTALPGGMFWRNNTGQTRMDGGNFVSFGLIGSPDILGVYKGRAIGIEVKNAKGKQSPSQVNFQTKFTLAGGLYILARSVDDVMEKLDGKS